MVLFVDGMIISHACGMSAELTEASEMAVFVKHFQL